MWTEEVVGLRRVRFESRNDGAEPLCHARLSEPPRPHELRGEGQGFDSNRRPTLVDVEIGMEPYLGHETSGTQHLTVSQSC